MRVDGIDMREESYISIVAVFGGVGEGDGKSDGIV